MWRAHVRLQYIYLRFLREVYASYRPISRPSSSSCMGEASSRYALDARSKFLRGGDDDVKHGCNSPRCVSRTSTSDSRAVYCRGGSRPKYMWGLAPLLFSLPLRYDTRRYFNVHSKADTSRLNLLHGNRQLKSEKQEN